jgi:hypothetical protein
VAKTDDNSALIGGIVGGAVGLLCIIAIVSIACKVRQRNPTNNKNNKNNKNNINLGQSTSESMNYGSVQLQSIASAQSPTGQYSSSSLHSTKVPEPESVYDFVHDVPNDVNVNVNVYEIGNL